jgi:pimeloyl-ACP methyl ester carboxylesterase
MTAHLAAFLDAVGVTRAPIVAQSMGGRIAVELARRDPARVRALALLGSVGMGHAPALRSLVRYVPAPRHALASVRVPRWLLALNKTYAYGSRARVVQDDVDAYWAAMEFPEFVPSMRRAVIDFDWRPLSRAQLAEIGVPTLVMFGTRDRVIRAHGVEERVAALAAGELVWVADAGHLPNEEMPDTVNSILVEFIGHTT